MPVVVRDNVHEFVDKELRDGNIKMAFGVLNQASRNFKIEKEWFDEQVERIKEHREFRKQKKWNNWIVISLIVLTVVSACILFFVYTRPYLYSESGCGAPTYEVLENEPECRAKCSKDDRCYGYIRNDIQRQEDGEIVAEDYCRLFDRAGSDYECQVKGERDLAEFRPVFLMATIVGTLMSGLGIFWSGQSRAPPGIEALP